MIDPRIEPKLSLQGQLSLHHDEDAAPLEAALAAGLESALAQGGMGAMLLELGARYAATPLPPTWAWLRELAGLHLALLRVAPEPERGLELAPIALAPAERERLLAVAPAFMGSERLDGAIAGLWEALDGAVRQALGAHDNSVAALLGSYDKRWHALGRVVLNLAENKKDPAFPFAFMATYTTRLAAAGEPQHLPLGRALQQYAGRQQRPQLISLLSAVQRAGESCPWLAAMVSSQEIFQPLRWTAREAAKLLSDVPTLEAAGVLVRMPRQWGGLPPSRPKVSAGVGSKPSAGIGGTALLDFEVQLTIDGEPLSAAEVEALLAQTDRLVLLRGRWVELDSARLARAKSKFEELAKRLSAGGLDFQTGVQLIAGADLHGLEPPDPDWTEVHAGPWLAAQLEALRAPNRLEPVALHELKATLRPYQELGVRWLDGLTQLGLGALLADDMGLGKTIQVIALLLLHKARGRGASLLVVPASLLGNWSQELERFAPSLRTIVAHGSAMSASDLSALDPKAYDAVITTYGTVSRDAAPDWVNATRWNLLVVDEAQAIKNPSTRQSRALKKLTALARVAMTGTPIENRLGDLWSLSDFLNPGLLGSAATFTRWMKGTLAKDAPSPWGPLRALMQPYLLRRRKDDKAVAPDLPDKTEIDTWCSLSRRQAALYQEAVDDLAEKLATSEGIQRRGLVLAALMRMKQICNHPSQWLGDGAWELADSGKLMRLVEIAETIRATQEKVIVFTQFREIAAVLERSLAAIFGAPGLVLTGQTPVAKRHELVRQFQSDDAHPFFVLSLKAGGTGLNLTAASHVVHFDRWWNPAVEDQATDRAFRIGQRRNVMVHKLVCRGTVEERIAMLISSKRALARDVIEGGAEVLVTEMSDEALMELVRLDIRSAVQAV